MLRVPPNSVLALGGLTSTVLVFVIFVLRVTLHVCVIVQSISDRLNDVVLQCKWSYELWSESEFIELLGYVRERAIELQSRKRARTCEVATGLQETTPNRKETFLCVKVKYLYLWKQGRQ